MRRREFMIGLGGTAAWSIVARAQQPNLPAVGFLCAASSASFAHLAAAFRQGLADAGYIEGESVVIDYRWADGRYDRLPGLAAELARRNVAVIAALGGSAPAFAAKAATSTIPIVFQMGADPVKIGLVGSLNHPGGNITGVTRLSTALSTKRLQLLNQLLPKADPIAFLINPQYPDSESDANDVQAAAASLDKRLLVLRASSANDIDAAFPSLVQRGAAALLLANDPYFNDRRDQLVALAARYAIPTFYAGRDSTAAGGLISYSASLADSFRQAGEYAGRILKGAQPGDLPIVQPTKFELVINIKTAKALGLAVPPTLMAITDEVIE